MPMAGSHLKFTKFSHLEPRTHIIHSGFIVTGIMIKLARCNGLGM